MTEIKKKPNLNISCKSPSKSNNFGITIPNINPISRPHSPLSISINDNEISLVQPTSKSSEYPSQFEIHKIHTIRDFLDTYKSPNDETELFEFPNIDYSETSKSGSNSKSKKRKKKRKRKNIKSNSSYKLKFNRDPNVSSSDITLIKKYHQNHLHTSNKSSGIPLFGHKKYNPNLLSVSPDKVTYNNNNNNNNNTNTINNINNITTNNDNNKKVTFLGLSPSDSITSPCGSSVAIDCDDDKLMPRILDDGNDIEIDEEIPLENFVKAILNGGVKILTDEQKRTQYKKANRIVRAASFCNLSQFMNPGIKDRTPGAQTDTNNDDIRRIKSLNNGSRSSTVDIVSINKHINAINDDTNSDSSPEPTEVKDGGPVFGVSSKSSELNKTHYVSEYSDTNSSSSSSWGTTDSDESDTTDDSDSNEDSNDTNNDNINININEVKNVEETNPNTNDINDENKNTSNINNHNKQTSLMDTLSKHIKKVRSSSINVRSSSRKKNRKYKRKIRGKSVNRKSKRKSNNNNDIYTIKESINDMDTDTDIEDSNSKYINDVYRNNGISLSICDISKNASNNNNKLKLNNSLSNKRTKKKRLKKHIKRRSLNCIKISRKKNIKRKKKRRRIKPRLVDVVSNPMPV